MGTYTSSPSEMQPDAKPKRRHSLKASANALLLSKRLAKYYGSTQAEVAEAALTLMQDHVEGVDVIQIPELMSSVADLEETVGRLIIQAEHLERLAFELAAFEADRMTG
jgi:hypothetical protein